MLKRFVGIKQLCMAAVLGCCVLFSGEAQAICSNNYLPQAYTYSRVQADGSKIVQVDGWDNDYPSYDSILVYKNGAYFTTVFNTYFSGVMTRGAGTWKFYVPNRNTCGNFTQHTLVWQVSN